MPFKKDKSVARTHDQNRELVCLVCFKKGNSMIKIDSGVNLSRVQKYFIENYDPNEEKIPNGLCSRCRIILLDIEQGKKSVSALPEPMDFSSLIFPAITRSSKVNNLKDFQHCTCSICSIVRVYPNDHTKPYPLGRPSLSDNIDIPTEKPCKICKTCLQFVGKGIHHPSPCGIRHRRENVQSLLYEDPRGYEIAVSTLVKEKVAESPSGSSYIQVATAS